MVTAAHCVYDHSAMAVTPPSDVHVYAGITDWTVTTGAQ